MASTAVHIANMREAIRDGTIPGRFAEGRRVWVFPTLAYLGARGATHFWTVRVRLINDAAGDYVVITNDMLDQPVPDLDGYKAEITVEAQQEGGKVRDTVPTYVVTGKNLGKKSATNVLTQAIRDALGLYNKQRRRGGLPAPNAAKEEGAAGEEEGAAGEEESAAGEEEGAAGEEEGAADGEEAAGAAPVGFDPTPPPMLVKKIGASREATLTPADFARGVTAQRKLNGVHFVTYVRKDQTGAERLAVYSRTGKPYPEQSQISAELLPMMLAAPKLAPGTFGLPEGAKMEQDRRILAAYGAVPGGEGPMPYFAGELFSFGKSLNWISGQSRRKKGDGSLQYHIFDVFFPYAKAAGHDMASRDRQAYIDAFFANADALGLPHPHVVRVANYPVRSMAELNARAKEFVREGFEGAIARKDWAGYRYSYSGYHAPNALKIKPVHDDEFPVVGYTQGRRGKDVGAIVWICEVPKPVDPRDKTFNVVPKEMTYDMRYKLFKCLGELVEGPGGKKTRFEHFVKGLPLTVEYAEISTKTGKPLQAKALAFRTYEAGPEHDPFRKVLKDCGAL